MFKEQGAAPATLVINFVDPFDYGNVTVGATSPNTFNVDNTGGVAANAIAEVGIAAPFQWAGGGAFPGAGGTCGVSLSAGANCDIVIEFAPAGAAFSADTIDISYDSGAGTLNVSRDIQGTGQTPATLSIAGLNPFDFGTVPDGSTNATVFNITNTGGSQATGMAGAGLAAPFRFTGGAYPGGGTCGVALNAAASCTIGVEYLPAGVAADADTMDINYNDGVAAQVASRDVQGNSVAPALLSISDSDPYNYGTLATGSSALHTFTITNTGTFQASAMSEVGLAAPYQYLGGAYPGTGGDCAATLNGAAACTIFVEYAPGVVSAADNDTIDFSYNDGVAGQNATRDVTGVAVAPATLSISDADPYDFGNVAVGATSPAHAFTITNTGGFIASAVSEVGLAAPYQYAGGGAYPGAGGTCGVTILPAAACDITVEFVPAATGIANDALDISYNNGASVVNSVRTVQGTGAAAATITITDADPYDYGNITVGSTATRTFTLQNTGAVSATGMGGAGLIAPYSFLAGAYPGAPGGTCGATLAPAATCDIVVEFAPAGAGLFNDTIDINF